MKLWASAQCAGISDDLFWELSPPEVKAVLDEQGKFERARLLRAALITSAIYNVNRKRGTPPIRPQDFIRRPPRKEDYMSIEEGLKAMGDWVEHQNKKVAQEGAG